MKIFSSVVKRLPLTRSISYKTLCGCRIRILESKGNFYSEMQRLTKAKDKRQGLC